MRRKFLFSKNAKYWNKLVRKFQKLHNQISRLISSANFSMKKYTRLSSKMNSVYKRLERMQTKVGVTLAGSTLALILTATTANAQMVQQPKVPGFHFNPLAEVMADERACDFIDIDNDGDLDILGGYYYIDEDDEEGKMYYYKNVGTVTEPIYEFQENLPEPFNTTFGEALTLKSVDFDNDGDKDIFIHYHPKDLDNRITIIRYFKNEDGIFVEQTEDDNPFNEIYFNKVFLSSLADIDNDGDIDLIAGKWNGNIEYFKNNSNEFVAQTNDDNPFNTVSVRRNAAPEFVDIDNDGDLDLFVPNESDDDDMASIYYFVNDEGSFIQVAGENNPLNINYNLDLANITFTDIDNDGDYDAFVNTPVNNLDFFKNKGNASTPAFEHIGLDVFKYSQPALVDIDNDNDLDLFISNDYNGKINYYENYENNFFAEKTGEDNPLDSIQSDFALNFTDIDYDKDYDLFLGDKDGEIKYYKNTGSAANITFDTEAEIIDINNEDSYASPTFIDYDDDIDYDMLVGGLLNGVYTVKLFENIGNINNYNFVAAGEQPFEDLTFNSYPVPTVIDFDKDGDLDLFIALKDSIKYYANEAGEYIEQTGNNNPFDGEKINTPRLTLGDVDGDGDIDAFVGTQFGNIRYYRNESPINVEEISSAQSTTKVYPSITTDIINAKSDEEISYISVIDITGKTVIKKSNIGKNATIDLSEIQTGIYIIKIQTVNNTFTQKIVKK